MSHRNVKTSFLVNYSERSNIVLFCLGEFLHGRSKSKFNIILSHLILLFFEGSGFHNPNYLEINKIPCSNDQKYLNWKLSNLLKFLLWFWSVIVKPMRKVKTDNFWIFYSPYILFILIFPLGKPISPSIEEEVKSLKN